MKKTNRFKNKSLTEADIDLFCRGVKDVLLKINERCSTKTTKKAERYVNRAVEEVEDMEEELIACN